MFARSMLRSAAPLKRSSIGVRRYASESSSGGGGVSASALGWAAVAGGVSFGGYYYYYANVLGKAPKIPNAPVPNKAAAAAAEPKQAFVGGDQDFLSLKLAKVDDINHNTKRFTFDLPESDQVSGVHVASALLTKFKNENMEKPVLRPYTPTSDEDTKGKIELVVKKYPDGPMSEHIHSMKPGDELSIKGPLPKYQMELNKHDHIALIAGGTGITPMWQVMRYIFKNPEDKTKVTLIFGNVTQQDILLKEKFDELENTYPQRFRAFYVLDNPPEGWEQGKGFITKDLLKTVLPEPKEANIKIMVCGPPGLCKAISGEKPSPREQGELEGALKELGYSKDQVYKF